MIEQPERFLSTVQVGITLIGILTGVFGGTAIGAQIATWLAPLKLDFSPEAYANPLTEAEIAMYRSSGITGFHNSVGVGGPTAYDMRPVPLPTWPIFVVIAPFA